MVYRGTDSRNPHATHFGSLLTSARGLGFQTFGVWPNTSVPEAMTGVTL
jgi:hypothetical protein